MYNNIVLVLQRYINKIKDDTTGKYRNIEIYEYNNPELVRYSVKETMTDKQISGHLAT